ncbi:ABC transporter substrate-binding protein [Cohnella fermenti]|uniref:Extracellular solute-binding protein n=1 Tax=Cohnella fermenti TaxID=2565925 RepID=A0A4S4BMN1_9BACL|nr:extracellular solute-binding protein [Cohnella fermenti]THF76094.1 extracellular solute-binding protein [Cohnella fermenti]
MKWAGSKENRGLALTLALTLGLSAIAAGCGNNNNGAATSTSGASPSANEELTQQSPASEGPKTKIAFWSHQSNLKDKMTELIDEYNRTNTDGIEIDLNVVADKYNDVLSLAFSTGEGPDIFTITGPSSTRKMVDNKWGQPLNDFITDEFKARFLDGVWVENNNVIGGQIYTLTDSASTMRLLYNKSLFAEAGLDPEKPPTTFAELRDYAKKIKEASGGKAAGFGLPMADGYNIDVAMLNTLGYSAIGLNRGFDHAQGKFDFAPYKPLLELFSGMQQDGSMLEGALLVSADQGRAKFAEGSIGMFGGASWDPGIYAGMDIGFDVGVAEFPTIDGTAKGKSSIQTGSGYMMSATAKDKEKTWKAMEFIFSTGFMGELVKQAGGISLLKDIAGNPAYQSDLKLLDQFQINDDETVWPPFPPGLKLQGDAMQAVFIQVINGQRKVDDALADLTKRYNEAFDQAIAEGSYTRESYTIPGFNPLG